MVTNPDWKEFVALLNSNEVEYAIVGALALAWHGYPRYTGELDLRIRRISPRAAWSRRPFSFRLGSRDITPGDLSPQNWHAALRLSSADRQQMAGSTVLFH